MTDFSLKNTIARNFLDDPRLKQAKQLIADAITDHQKHISKVSSGATDQVDNYQKMIQELSQNRGGNLFYRYIGSGFGNGPLVELADGSVKYDFITGIGVHYFGHSHKDIVLASVQGAMENTPMQGHLQQNYSSALLIKILLEQANKYQAGLGHVFLTSSGAMANENALKIAFQKRSPASRILAFEKCFSGRTLGLSFVTDKAAYRQGLPKTLDVDYLPFFDEKNPEQSTKNCVQTLKKYLKRYPKQHACLIFEPILGEGGSWAGDKNFFHEVLTLARSENISIISDEVQAFGRTSELYAFQYYGLDKLVDIVTIGKMSQVCATLFKEDHKPGAGLVSQTFTSSSSAIHASLEVLKKLTTENFLGKEGKIERVGNSFRQELKKLAEKYPSKVSGPFGVGAMVAMTVFEGDSKKSQDFTYKLFDAGVISFTAGDAPTRIRFLMPVGAIEEHHIKEVSQIIEKVLGEMN
jgi:4-aminobutyrate aminotransferase-like enzyme